MKNQPPKPPPVDTSLIWEQQVSSEAMNFVAAVQHNFRHGLIKSKEFLPKPLQMNDLARQLDYFMDAVVGVTVQCIAKYANPSERMEDAICDQIRTKFKYIREQLEESGMKFDENPNDKSAEVVPFKKPESSIILTDRDQPPPGPRGA